MDDILEGQVLEIDNLLSYRGKLTQDMINTVLCEMKQFIIEEGAQCKEPPITATYAVENTNNQTLLDIEILIPISQKIESNTKYIYKDKIKIVNAIMLIHKDGIETLQRSCDKLSNYIINNKLTPLTVGYNVTKVLSKERNEAEIRVYVGLNPNIL